MTIKEVIQFLERWAPPAYQESYDNAGLLTGDTNWEAQGALVTLDVTEPVIDEAIANGCNLVIAHHPIIFGSLKRLTGKNYVERTVIKAIKNDVAIYAIHTNLDNVHTGVNHKIASLLGLENTRILSPKKGILKKLVTFAPEADAEKVRQGLFNAGAGEIGDYDHCSYNLNGQGTFRAGDAADPYVGQKGETHFERETRIEVIYPAPVEQRLLAGLQEAHPYEEVAYDIYPLENEHPWVGAGMMGELPEPVSTMDFLQQVKSTFNTGCVRYTPVVKEKVQRIAVCGGAGSFLLGAAMGQQADVFVTGDFKYHQFFDADGRIVIADIGHYESEQFTKDLIRDALTGKFNTFAVTLSKTDTNPVNYL